MSEYLLLVALGPVQDFIAQARRTRDLWYGSHLLSELSRAAARHLTQQKARLVFPALDAAGEFVLCRGPLRPDGKPPQNVANRLLAEVPEGVDPRELARGTRDAVLRCWREDLAEPVRNRCRGLLASDVDAVWDEQIETLPEFTAAWASLADHSYPEARAAVQRAVSARRNLRDFEPWRHLRGTVRKSSLDGERETVLRSSSERSPELVRRYGIGDGEQLDAVGLVKRAGGEPEQFVPIVNTAVACWLSLAAEHAGEALGNLRDAARKLHLRPVRDVPAARPFPFDGSILFRGRWKAVIEEQDADVDPSEWGSRHVGPLLAALHEPFPYVACLVADGDRIGPAIARLTRVDAHRALSSSLAGFAGGARRIVEQEHLGSLVYAGGDDVLAFLPLPTALACAEKLRDAFAAAMSETDLLPEQRPTLSVGIGVGYFMEGMGDLLDLGREAERLAKQESDGADGRNALAVMVDRRSGVTRRWRAGWETAPAARLREDARLLEARLPMTKVHEIARTVRQLPEPSDAAGQGWTRVLSQEVRRSLARVGAGEAGGVEPVEVGLRLEGESTYAERRHEVRSWLERMLVARTFAMAAPRRRGLREGAL